MERKQKSLLECVLFFFHSRRVKADRTSPMISSQRCLSTRPRLSADWICIAAADRKCPRNELGLLLGRSVTRLKTVSSNCCLLLLCHCWYSSWRLEIMCENRFARKPLKESQSKRQIFVFMSITTMRSSFTPVPQFYKHWCLFSVTHIFNQFCSFLALEKFLFSRSDFVAFVKA